MYGKLKYLIVVFLLIGCAAPDYYKKDSAPIAFTENVEAVQTVQVKDFLIIQNDLTSMSDEIKIKLDLTEPLSLLDFFQVIGAATKLQFIFDSPKPAVAVELQGQGQGQAPAAPAVPERIIVLGKYSGSLKGLLSLVQNTYGLFFHRVGDSFVVRDESICILRVLPQQHVEDMQGLVAKTFGVKDVVLDSRVKRDHPIPDRIRQVTQIDGNSSSRDRRAPGIWRAYRDLRDKIPADKSWRFASFGHQ